jgi:predicted alpha/beta-fold hydrolase
MNVVRDIKYLTDYDNFVTAPFHGFKDRHDYYDRASSFHKISSIKVPTLILNALDDPILGAASIDYEKC